MTTKWALADPADMTSHTFAVNPRPGTGSGDITDERPVTNSYQDRNGTMVTLGQKVQPTSKLQVDVLTTAEHDTLWSWYDKHAVLTLTDDLGRTMTIILTSFAPNRTRKASNPFYRQITANFIVLTLVEA